MNAYDSSEVLALKAMLDEPFYNDGSDCAVHYRRILHGRIRAQRMLEARSKGTHTYPEWLAVMARYGNRCVRCGCYPDPRPCKDHIVPVYQGGSDAVENLQPLCRQCNTAKGPDSFNWAHYRDEHGFPEVEQ